MVTVPERFRPALVIFTDDLGADPPHAQRVVGLPAPPTSVFTYFEDLCAGLASVLWPALGVLRVTSAGAAEMVHLRTAPQGEVADIPYVSGDFKTVFTAALAAVQSEDVYRQARNAGVTMHEMNPQIFIVGSSASRTLSQAAHTIAEVIRPRPSDSAVVVRHRPLNPQVCYVVKDAGLDAPPDDAADPSWAKDLVSNNGDLPLVNFCFLFEDYSDRGTIMKAEQIHYVMAETLFGLVATGIHASEIYRATADASPLITNSDQRIGSLSPVMVRFPRAELTTYCADVMAEQVVSQWHETLLEDANTPTSDQGTDAVKRVREIYGDIGEGYERPGLVLRNGAPLLGPLRALSRYINRSATPRPGENSYPGMAFLYEPPRTVKPTFRADATYEANLDLDRDAAENMNRASEQIFDYFDYHRIKAGSRARSWQETAREEYYQAGTAFTAYGRAAAAAFERAGKRLQGELEADVDTMFVNDDSGLSEARHYLQGLDDTLRQSSVWCRDELRAQHQAAYDKELGRFRKLADNPRWPITESSSATPVSVRPFGDAFATAITHAAEDDGRPLLSHLDELRDDSEIALTAAEQHVVDGLEARIEWMTQHIPHNQMIAGFVALATPVLTVLLFPYFQFLISLVNLIPPLSFLVQLTSLPTNGLETVTTVAGILYGAGKIFQRLTSFRRDMAGRDLLDAYRLFIIYRAEIREDQLRIAAVLGPLTTEVSSWFDTAKQYKFHMGQLRDHFAQAAADGARQMFSGPRGVRDVLIGNGQELSPHGYTPADFYAEFDRQRTSNEDEATEWHRTYETISDNLRTQLIETNQSTIKLLAKGALDAEIRQYMYAIVSRYLNGPLVEISYALAGMGGRGANLWRRALDRAAMLFAPPSALPSYLFYAGRDDDIAYITPQVIPHDATRVQTSHPEWLYIALLNQGDAGTDWGDGPQGPSENSVGEQMRVMIIKSTVNRVR